ncbi:hypothetical protein [Gordonia sp. NPDC003376]
MHPPNTTQTGRDHAIEVANRAFARVPAYRALVRSRRDLVDVIASHEDFLALPATSKANYLQRHAIPQLMWDGDIAGAGTWSATSGSTGSPTFFPRDVESITDAIGYYGRIFSENFRIGAHESTLFLVCFAMGTWIGGTYSYQAGLGLRAQGMPITVSTTGIDVAAAVKNLAELGPHHDKIVVAGYPPLVKDVLDQTPDDALAQDIQILLAGEAITEPWRDHLLDRIGRVGQPHRICLMYGTAEAGVMGHETRASIAVRRAAQSNPQLRKELFGEGGSRFLPTFVEVDQSRRYTEVDDDGYLLFTIDSALPLIRYRINDKGAVVTGAHLQDLLAEYAVSGIGDQIDPAASFIALTGRTDVATTFYSSNIYPRHLSEAFDAPEVDGLVTGKFYADGSPDEQHDPRLRVAVELSARTRQVPEGLAKLLADLCRASLLANNEEYRTLHAERPDRTEPRITLYPYGTGPFVPGIKQPKHIYAGGK